MTWHEAVARVRNDPEYVNLTRDAYFDLPVISAARRYHASAEWQAIRRIIPRPTASMNTALDLGAGNGIASYALASDGWHVLSVEPDPSSEVGAAAIRELTQSTELPIQVVEGYGEQIPAASDSVDVVFARQVLHHAQDLPKLCREIARVLKRGGMLVSARDHVISTHADLNAFLTAHPLHHMYHGENAFTFAEYQAALEGAGLRIARVVRSFDSVINFAPHTLSSLRGALSERAAQLPGGRILRLALALPGAFPVARRVLSRFDKRPGRLVTFVCTKP